MSDLDFMPKALLTDDDKYVLQDSDIYNLLKFTWTGSLLPTNETAFKSRVNVSNDNYNRLRDLLDPLLSAYVTTQDTCFRWNSMDYPSIVSIASDILEYASNVGGDIDDSYYGIIFDDILALKGETDPTKIKDLKDEIFGLIDDCVETIDGMTGRADAAVTKLQTFETAVTQEQSVLQGRHKNIYDALAGKGGEIATLNDKIKKYKAKIAEDQKEYEHDVIVASTAPAYAWCTVFGAIAAATVMGVYGSRAVNMKNEINALTSLMNEAAGEVKDDMNIVATLTNVDTDLDAVLAQIGPAITTIQKMRGAWGAVRDDLTSIRTYVDKDVRKANAAIAKVQKRHVVGKWNNLADEIKKYRLVAYVTPQQTTLEEYNDAINKEVKG